MSLIIVNETERTTGEAEISQRVVEDEDKKKFIVYEGVLVCDKYFEVIDTIKTGTLLIEGVFVHQELFSSKTSDIQYIFTATKFEYIGGDQ